jgi:hypothetical protein
VEKDWVGQKNSGVILSLFSSQRDSLVGAAFNSGVQGYSLKEAW